MDNLERIPIVVPGPTDPGTPLNALAILEQIDSMLDALAASGKADGIDLGHSPLTPEDHRFLTQILGRGEVRAELDSLGRSEIRETAVPGVWWLTHRNQDGKVLGEFIEVTSCPEILITPREEIASARSALRTRLRQRTVVADPADTARRLEAMGIAPSKPNRFEANNPESKAG